MTKSQGLAILATSLLLFCASAAVAPAQSILDVRELAGPHPASGGHVYWTNTVNGSVGRATTAGSAIREGFIKTKIPGGGGLTLNRQYIYWTSANGGSATTIARAGINGKNVDLSFITGAQNPCGVAVDSAYIYWAGDVGSSMGRANLDGSGVNQDFISTGRGVCGVAVTKKYIYWANYETGQIGRANIDGSNVNLDFISGCGSGIAIKGKYIYFTTTSGTGIGRANLDGSGVNLNFISGLSGTVAFLAADSSYIFWADWGSRGSGTTIGRANINGSGVSQNFITGTKGGFGIAVTGGDP